MCGMNAKRSISSRVTAYAMVVCFLCGWVYSATINVRVVTDKSRYKAGDTVLWTLYAWASSGDNRGVSFLSLCLDDNTDDRLPQPFVNPNGTEFLDSVYGAANRFELTGEIDVSDVGLDLKGISVAQSASDMKMDVGNDGWSDHVLAKGSYTVSVLGEHTLAPSFYRPEGVSGADYWFDATGAERSFEIQNAISSSFVVVLNADVNKDYYVNYGDYAMIAARWQRDDCDSSWDCDGADLSRDGVVDLVDIIALADQWLNCTDPDESYCDDFWR